jgi:hypothetical protein
VRGLSDRGTFRVRRDLATRRDRWRLVGRRGTLVVSQIRNRWTIVSGTRAYVRLRGSGTSTVGESVTGFRAVWRGALTG